MLSWPVLPTDSSRNPEAFGRDCDHSADHLRHAEARLSGCQCRDTPARTGERENDEKTVDDRTVKFSPVAWRMAWCLLSVFFLRALCAPSSTTYTCVLCSPGYLWFIEARFWLEFRKVIFCLLSISVSTTQCK